MLAQLDSQYIKTRPTKATSRILSHLFFQGRFLTTNYRWLNKLILAELSLLKKMPPLKKVEKPIFIIGTGRSGSTILGKVLSMHRDIGFLNEPKAMWYSIDPREDVNGHFTSGSAQYRFGVGDVTSDKIRWAQRLFGNYLALTGSKRVLDKNPEIVFRVPFVQSIFPDAKFIFLTRNGWNTCASIVKWSKRYGIVRDGNREDWWGVNNRKWKIMIEELVVPCPIFADVTNDILGFRDHANMAAVEWIVTMQEGLRYLDELPEVVHLLRYEDLLQNPQRILSEVLRFCDLPPDDTLLNYAEKSLNYGEKHAKVELHPSIMPLFREIMMELGYNASQSN